MAKKEKDITALEILRTKLSIKQTAMSCQRSLLSYIRTACVFVSLAFTYLKIAAYDNFDWFVITMFCIGGFFLAFGVAEYVIAKKRTKNLEKHLDRKFISDSVAHDLLEEED